VSIHVHIERLILNGITLPRCVRAAFREALQDELGHLLAEGGLSPKLQGGTALPRISAPGIQIGAPSSPGDMGRQVARAVYAGIGSQSAEKTVEPRGEPG
jgi:hypothetical protein